MDENEDDVKVMNRMVLSSRVHTIRDQQLKENKQLEEEWHQYQNKMNTIMEIERLKDLQAQEKRKQVRAEAALKGGQVLVQQILDREEARLRHREILEMEKEQMHRNIQIGKKLELEAERVKVERTRALMAEIEASNRITI